MPDIRTEAKEAIDRMADDEVRDIWKFMSTFPDPVTAACRNAPWDDEPVTEDEERSVRQVDKWFKQNGGRGIPHAEVMRRRGLD